MTIATILFILSQPRTNQHRKLLESFCLFRVWRKDDERYEDFAIQHDKSMRVNMSKCLQYTSVMWFDGSVSLFRYHGKWNGQQAVQQYKKILAAWNAKRSDPHRPPRFRGLKLIEDNDPTGYKSTTAKEFKSANKMEVVSIPPKSPQVSPCDFFLHAYLKVEFAKFLKRTGRIYKNTKEGNNAAARVIADIAKKTNKDSVKKSIYDSMKKRIRLMYEAEGGYFQG